MTNDGFGSYLKRLRGLRGFSVNQLAMYSGVSSAQVSRVENGQRAEPKPETIQKLSVALKVPYEELMAAAGYYDEPIARVVHSAEFDEADDGTLNIVWKIEPSTIPPTKDELENIKKLSPEVKVFLLQQIKDIADSSVDQNKDVNVIKQPTLTAKEERDIAKDLERILSDLESEEALAYNGEPMDEETKRLMVISLENSMRLAKEMAKKKFTPNKYKK